MAFCEVFTYMKKINRTVLNETGYIALSVLIFSMLMQAVFLVIGKWDITVLLGNILGGAAAVGNFFLMGLTVQNAVEKEEKEAKNLMRFSQNGRLFLMFIVALVGYLVPIFNLLCVVIPFIFPRIAVMARPIFDKKG